MSLNQNTTPRNFKQTGATPRPGSVYMGIVRMVQDPQRMGRIAVWIPDFGPDEKENYITVSYASPFGGVTPISNNNEDGKTMEDSQSSYGFWATPPHIDNHVLVCFLNADIANGYYFASAFPQNMNHMIPGIGWSKPSTDPEYDKNFGTYGPPTVEYNKKDRDILSPTSKTPKGAVSNETVKRPPFTPLADALIAQGLTQDPERGISNSSARRESPSRVMGMLSPRGNGIVIDDGAEVDDSNTPNEFIRFRTRSGAQILIHEGSGYIYIITKQGRSWVEISDGGIDMYTEDSFSVGAGGDINLSAGGAVNIQGGSSINLSTAEINSYASGNSNHYSGGDVLNESGKNTFFKAGETFGVDAEKNIESKAEGDIIEASCGANYRTAVGGIGDNIPGAPIPDTVPSPEQKENVVTRKPTHEPFDHLSGSAGIPTGTNANGEEVIEVIDSDGNVSEAVSKNTKEIMKFLYSQFVKLGFTREGALTMVAQIGRENDFVESVMFGSHRDDGNSATNIGIVSWQGSRRTAFINYLKSRGGFQNGKLIRNWKMLAIQCEFVKKELSEQRLYRKSWEAVRRSDWTYTQIEPVLSNNYEVWDRAGKKIGKVKARNAMIKMKKYYDQVKSITS